MNKVNKYNFLNKEIITNYFLSDTELAKLFINKYKIHDKQKNVENYIFRIKKESSIISILNNIISKFNNDIPTVINLKSRYYNKFLSENKHLSKFKFKNNIINIIRNDDILNGIEIIFDNKQIKTECKSKLIITQLKINNKIKKSKLENVLVIADLHEPFTHEDYFEFCKNIAKKYNTTKTIFIGDLIDNHASSFHQTNSDGFSAGDELDLAIKGLNKWHTQFPNSIILKGNHESIIYRKINAGGLSTKWIKELKDVLETPTWTYLDKYDYNNIRYIHGDTVGDKAAYDKALYSGISIVMGHSHSQASIQYVNQTLFGMIVGSGVSQDKYAFEYSRGFRKPFMVSCGVVIDSTPIIETLK